MSIPLRRFFIVLDRNRENKNELQFNVSFFYLKSFKKKTFTFTYVNEPFFRGTVIFGLDFKNKMRPLNLNKIEKDGTYLPIDPRIFNKFLLLEKNKFIAFSNQTPMEDTAPVRQMLKSFQFDKNKIINLMMCSTCLEKNKFTLLNEKIQIESFNNQIICKECAYKIILSRIKLTGLFSQGRISLKLKNFFTHIILKFKDIKKVLTAFQADFNLTKNRNITLYDIEKSPAVGKKYYNQKIENLDIPPSFKRTLKNLNLSDLLPIQTMAIERGLLAEHSNQLIMAPTSGGKTLVGELAGITRILKNKNAKMMYLVPIVALANIRTDEFKKKYRALNLKIIKKIGESFFVKKDEVLAEDLISADIIIATYEAIDYLLRSGKKELLGNIGTIIIDEIQTLIDSERGFILDGLISRLKALFDSQFLYLSATVGEPELLAEKLKCQLIRYDNRPVPIERHLVLCLDEAQKHKYIARLVTAAYHHKSKYGFKGQSIIFTNTRKKCESISAYLQGRGISVSPYHSGLTHVERKIIEENFISQKLVGVVATAALAAGVDLPAKQVIFESLAMGIKWLSVAEFEQMVGRSGRLKKHELGLAYLLIEPGKVYSPKMKISEENTAINLLNGKIKDFELIPDDNKSAIEILAFISMFNKDVNMELLVNFHSNLINDNFEMGLLLKKLIAVKLIRIKENYEYRITRLGKSIASSFLTLETSLDIIEKLKKRSERPLNIAFELNPLRNVYLSNSIVADLSKNVKMKYFSNNLFSVSSKMLMNAEQVKKRKKFSRSLIDYIMKWTRDIFNCNCKDNPYCDCGQLNLEKLILKLRVEEKLSIEQISHYFEEEYQILIFKGDLIDYLESLIYSLESIKNIGVRLANLDKNYLNEILEIPSLIEEIKY